MADKECFLSEEEYHTNLLKTRLEISPALFQKTGKHSESRIKEIHELVNTMCKTKSTISKEESFSHDADYHTNLLKKKLEISPAKFQKSGKHSESKIKEIHESVDTMCKTKPTKSKEADSFSHEKEGQINSLQNWLHISTGLYSNPEKRTESKTKERHGLDDKICKTRTTQSEDVLPRFTRSETMKKGKLPEVDAAVYSIRIYPNDI